VIRREGERMYVSGSVTLQNVTGLLREGMNCVRDGVSVVDLSEVSGLDSSLLAALLAWIREARDRNHPLAVSNLPRGLNTLAQLYGVEELLPVAATH
jgi:phospholipid transport system transporter-binding protein